MKSWSVRAEDLVREAERLLNSLSEGKMSVSAYDTAWVARVPNPDIPEEPLFPSSYDWLLRNQHEDGSWGAEIPFAHDRVISTMAALVTLAAGTYRREDSEPSLRRAILYLNRERPNLRDDAAETVGFELLLPELVRQAQALGLGLPYQDWRFVESIRTNKLKGIPPIAVYGGPTTLTTSLEYLGDNVLASLLGRCQCSDGSFGASPSATAYAFMRNADPSAAAYLRSVASLEVTGGVRFLHPFEIFETAWVLYYLDSMVLGSEVVQPHLRRLLNGWTPAGASWTRIGTVPDVDDTTVVMLVLGDHGQQLDDGILGQYESNDYFYTFPLERNPSISANAHVLETLRRYPSTPERRRMMLKLVYFLRRQQVDQHYWTDKWHVSPLYATDQAIRALAGLAEDLVRPAVQWLLDTQQESGAWGLQAGTHEETALVLGSLLTACEFDPPLGLIAEPAMSRAALFLSEGLGRNSYPSLWRGKGLYTPENIVESIVLSALHRWVVRFTEQP